MTMLKNAMLREAIALTLVLMALTGLAYPGVVTGLAQVSGRNELLWAARIELDLRYIQRLSLIEDLKIILATVRMVLLGEGLYSAYQQRDGL